MSCCCPVSETGSLLYTRWVAQIAQTTGVIIRHAKVRESERHYSSLGIVRASTACYATSTRYLSVGLTSIEQISNVVG